MAPHRRIPFETPNRSPVANCKALGHRPHENEKALQQWDTKHVVSLPIRRATSGGPLITNSSYQMLRMFAFVFGIPMSFAALLTGVLLGLGTRWGIFGYPWVTIKLLLILSVIAVGALVLNGGMNAMVNGRGGAEGRLIAGAAYDVVALDRKS